MFTPIEAGLAKACGRRREPDPAARYLDLIEQMMAHDSQGGAGAGADDGGQGEEIFERRVSARAREPVIKGGTGPIGNGEDDQSSHTKAKLGQTGFVPVIREDRLAHLPDLARRSYAFKTEANLVSYHLRNIERCVGRCPPTYGHRGWFLRATF